MTSKKDKELMELLDNMSDINGALELMVEHIKVKGNAIQTAFNLGTKMQKIKNRIEELTK